ncbi:MAG: hypothetical protein JKX72_12290 [Robiginitomaculum sp.]|nr:hypothetical protein [Robiginitomaculum sp.]
MIGFAASPAFAQVDDNGVIQNPTAAQIADQQDRDVIIVTGSRLRKSTYESASPITTLDVGSAIQIGVTSINELVNRATVVKGNRTDSSFNSNAGNSNASEAPPTGGTGSSNVNLRGLGSERTLIKSAHNIRCLVF